jgi:hypothetical protein
MTILAEHKTEPNSGLGKAITYLLRHWKALTTFLQARCPAGQQHRGKSPETRGASSQECFVLSHAERGAGRPIHERGTHLPAVSRELLR